MSQAHVVTYFLPALCLGYLRTPALGLDPVGQSSTKGLNSTRQMTGLSGTDSGFSPVPQQFSLGDGGRGLEAERGAGLGCSR